MADGARFPAAAPGHTMGVLTPRTSTRGRLLVATPPLGDPNFDRTVVYMLEHGDIGAVGVIVNRLADLADLVDLDDRAPDVGDAWERAALSDWRPLLSEPAVVFLGGPVATDSLIAIARGIGRNDEAWGTVTDSLGTVDLSLAPDEAAEQIDRVRIFRGYAGWSVGQLDAEIEAGAWMVFECIDDDLFTSTPDDLWRAVVRRQGGRLAWIADAPDDLSAN
ncbi:MAG: YqgE/AlgH family protein [Ilumatobacteraceae bacterium]